VIEDAPEIGPIMSHQKQNKGRETPD